MTLDEERLLRHWMYVEVHYQEGVGLAKKKRKETSLITIGVIW
jgi:hypothetical protein